MFMNKLFNISETKFGEKIIDLGSSKRFSLEIYYKTNKVISYNTIRRIYGVVSKHSLKNRKSTLDIFSEYCGYKNHYDFNNSNQKFNDWNFGNRIINLLNKKDYRNIINDLKNYSGFDKYDLIANAFNKFVVNNKYDLLLKLFESNTIDEDCCSIVNNEDILLKTKFCNQISFGFNSIKNKSVLINLGKSKSFVQTFIHHHIDYSNSKNFNIVLSSINENEFNYTDVSFKKLYLNNYNLFSLKNLDNINISSLNINYKLLENEYVKARYFTYKLFLEEFNFLDYFKIKNKNSIKLISGLLPICLIKKNYDLLKKIIEYYDEKERINNSWENINEWLGFDIFKSIHLLINGQNEESIDSLNEIEVLKRSNIQCLDLNWTYYYFAKIIIKGPNDKNIKSFKKSNSKIYINLLNEKLAIDIRNYAFSKLKTKKSQL